MVMEEFRTGICGVTMTESLIKYYNNAENNPVSSKEQAVALTKEVYVDVTNQDGKNDARRRNDD
jgi:hypothetical protein